MTGTTQTPVTPERIQQFAWGYVPPLILEAAIRHRVFDTLDAAPKTVAQVATATGASERGLASRLYRIKARTMLIWGEGDKLIPPVYAQAFQRGITGAELVVIREAGHVAPFEKPAEVIGAIARLQ